MGVQRDDTTLPGNAKCSAVPAAPSLFLSTPWRSKETTSLLKSDFFGGDVSVSPGLQNGSYAKRLAPTRAATLSEN